MPLPREILGAKDAAILRELPKARDAGNGISQTAQSLLKLGVGFDCHARAKSAREEINEEPAVNEPNVDPSPGRARR